MDLESIGRDTVSRFGGGIKNTAIYLIVGRVGIPRKWYCGNANYFVKTATPSNGQEQAI